MSDHQFKARSLYRSFLRAASYLPDLFARAYVQKQIVSRFKSAEGNVFYGTSKRISSSSEGFLPLKRLNLSANDTVSEKLVKAQKKLRILTRATQGDSQCLEKVLMLVHGRLGRRKRELIKDLFQDDSSDIPQNTAALLEILDRDSERLRKEGGFIKLGPKFKAFLQSQHENKSKDIRGTIKDLEPKIPKENIWGRSIPLKRVENIKKKWWAAVLNKLLPPIPEDEFERLGDLSFGKLPLDTPPPKRKPAVPLHKEDKAEEWIEILKSPLRKINEAHINFIKCTPSGLVIDNKQNIISLTTRKSQFQRAIRSQRSMRRLYGKIWALTSFMFKDKNTDTWVTKWGLGSSKFLAGEVSKPNPSDMELFDGLEKFYSSEGTSKRKPVRPDRKEKVEPILPQKD